MMNNHDQIEEHEISFYIFFFSKNKAERTEENHIKRK